MEASELASAFLTDWHRIVAERDLEGLRKMLAEDVSMGAPPYWQRLEGRELVHHLLGLIIHTIEAFTYHREWQQDGELALEFTGRVEGLDLQGIDLISLDTEGSIARLDVLIRPVNAVNALMGIITPQVAKFLAERG